MHHAGSGRQHLRFLQHISGLPVEVVVRHGKQHFLAPVRVEGAELGRLAAVVRVRQQIVDQDVALEGALGGVAVRLGVRRNADLVVHQHGPRELVLGRRVVEVEAKPRTVGGRFAVGRVVHLEDDGGARRQQRAGAVRVRLGNHARHIAAKAATPPPASWRRVPGRQRPSGDHMMQRRPVAGQNLRTAHPDVLIERIGHKRVLVLHHAARRHVERRNVDDHIRLAHLPKRPVVLVERQRIFPLAAAGAGLGPMHQGARLGGAERAVVGELAVHRIGVPRGHAARAHHLANHRREAAHDGVVPHRPWADAAIAVACDAVFGQQRRDVVHIGDVGLRGAVQGACVRDFATRCH